MEAVIVKVVPRPKGSDLGAGKVEERRPGTSPGGLQARRGS